MYDGGTGHWASRSHLPSPDAEATRQMIAAVRTKSDRPFQVNVFCHRPATPDTDRETAWLVRLGPEFARYEAKPPARLTEIYQTFLTDDAKLAVLLAERPVIVSFHFGLPARDRGAPLARAMGAGQLIERLRRETEEVLAERL